ncbi:Crp/Fnr family transcriptional regulator [Robertkochia aurantiaca]|uniref:Crp/Fnr family transcriptional regulator n=1 Tax=Robertkochia aurantiaca TaxID=2873700 RepID=UPI001CCB7B0D|nr:Crp/Fnr family transcriptional regulator [Robertkochia sp. 3YJGBD-33]
MTNDKILNALSEIHPLHDTVKKKLIACMSERTLTRHEHLLSLNETCKHLYFINEGFVRIYYYKHGKDITEYFAGEKQFCFSINSYFAQSPSKLMIQALEDSRITLIPKSELDRLRAQYLDLANLVTEMFSLSLMLSQERMDSIQFESAAQRYRRLLKEQPQILNKASLQHIASYLGITAETLSRIRTQVF